MQHGRDHDERQSKAQRPSRSTPSGDSDVDLEAQMALSGRNGIRPDEGLVGAQYRRAEHTTEGNADAGTAPPPNGSEYAPTAQATRRERERHRLEREKGHVAAGTVGVERASQLTDVSREAMREAALEADRRIIGHAVKDAESVNEADEVDRAWLATDENISA